MLWLALTLPGMAVHSMDGPRFTYSFINCWTLGLFHRPAAVNLPSSANIHGQVFVWTPVFCSFGNTYLSGIARSFSNSIFTISRNCQTQKATYCMIPFLGNVQSRQIPKMQKADYWLSGTWREKMGNDRLMDTERLLGVLRLFWN